MRDVPEVQVVCATYRRAHLLARLVAALEAQDFPLDRVEVCIVDDGSSDGTVDELHRLAGASPLRLTALCLDHNVGAARARNQGWRSGTAPLVAFVDDDCVPEPGWLRAGVEALRADPRRGVVQGAVHRPPDAVLQPWSVFREHHEATPFFEGCNVFYRRDALDEGGGFSEAIGWYGEDTEAAWSVLDRGWGRGFAGAAIVVHDVEDRGVLWHVRNGYLERNLIGVGARHPGFASEAYWRRHVWKPHVAAVSLAGLALVLCLVAWTWFPVVLTVPWLWLRWPRRGYRSHPLLGPQRFVVDGAQAVGHLAGSLRHGTLVL